MPPPSVVFLISLSLAFRSFISLLWRIPLFVLFFVYCSVCMLRCGVSVSSVSRPSVLVFITFVICLRVLYQFIIADSMFYSFAFCSVCVLLGGVYGWCSVWAWFRRFVAGVKVVSPKVPAFATELPGVRRVPEQRGTT